VKRDQRLHGLTSEHHQALVLARRLRAGARTALAETRLLLTEAWDLTLEPHFALEEELLLPGLEAAEPDLVTRTQREHAHLRELVSSLPSSADPGAVLLTFADALERHVRFEENELLVACERLLPPAALTRVAEHRPHNPGRAPAPAPSRGRP
jgi:hypothetical protein